MRAQPGHDQPQDVEHLAHRPDRAARTGDRGTLAQGEGGRQVVDAIGVGPLGLGQPAAAVGAQPLQKPLHALGVEGADGQRRFSRTGNACHDHRSPERDVHVDVHQVVVAHPRTSMTRGSEPGTGSQHGDLIPRLYHGNNSWH